MGANGYDLGVTSKEQPGPERAADQIGRSIGTLMAVVLLAFLAAAPFAWLLMLFLGNMGLDIGFWGCVPGGAMVGMLVAGGRAK